MNAHVPIIARNNPGFNTGLEVHVIVDLSEENGLHHGELSK
jgi:hypothetical protein